MYLMVEFYPAKGDDDRMRWHLSLISLVCGAFLAGAEIHSLDVIDTHVHNANLSLINYTFTTAFPDLARDWTIEDFSMAVDGAPVRVRGALLMELEKQHNTFEVGMAEAQMFQATADRCDQKLTPGVPAGCVPVSGFVASAPLESEPAALDSYLTNMRTKYPAFRGVRQPLWKRNATFFLGKHFMQGLSVLGGQGLPFDLLVEAAQLRDIATLVAQHPNVRFNLNHLGYPNTSSTDPMAFAAWARDISALAQHDNVYCKVSGLPQTYGHAGWTANDFMPFVKHVLKVFGPNRLNFAGNWFVLMEERWHANYSAITKALLQTLDALNVSARNRKQIFVDTATELYNLH